MASINSMVKRLHNLVGTPDLNDWETKFVTNLMNQSQQGENTTSLTEPQIERLEELFDKHFAA